MAKCSSWEQIGHEIVEGKNHQCSLCQEASIINKSITIDFISSSVSLRI